MGLDLYVKETNVYSCPYSQFARLRVAIAAACGSHSYGKAFMVGPSNPDLANKMWADAMMELKGNKLKRFLMHSDCDGYIGHNHASKLVIYLSEILPCIDASHHKHLNILIKAFETASLNKCKIEFR